MLKLIEYFAGTARMRAEKENKNKVLSYMQNNGVFFTDLFEKDGAAYFTVLGKNVKDKTLLQYAEVIEIKGFGLPSKNYFLFGPFPFEQAASGLGLCPSGRVETR